MSQILVALLHASDIRIYFINCFRVGTESRFLSGFAPMGGASLWIWNPSMGCCWFYYSSPVHSSRTSPSFTLQTKALSSSPPVTAMLFVAGSKFTQKTEPGQKTAAFGEKYFKKILWSKVDCFYRCVWRRWGRCHPVPLQPPSHLLSPILHHRLRYQGLRSLRPPSHQLNHLTRGHSGSKHRLKVNLQS